MSEELGQPWGMCAAFGCPLLGTVGSEGRWYCFCHVNKPSNFNDAITRELRDRQMPIVEATLSIRRHFSSFHDVPEAYRAIQRLLIDADRKDLLLGAGGADCSPHRPGKPIVKMWLTRRCAPHTGEAKHQRPQRHRPAQHAGRCNQPEGALLFAPQQKKRGEKGQVEQRQQIDADAACPFAGAQQPRHRCGERRMERDGGGHGKGSVGS
ncbi:hypothetical protein F4827_002554 [Paraburkholderia bannensis]|uniref:Uncharacterized protein n=1 Tax=Paraburkholderia bannensis TaxID=765414 RepID=A0A7W9WSU7_9BURK|nr:MULTISPECIES: hypothetical protein [Paraburkholderia]MBB3257689.1 hypothetical protein [Paraburkholderia sp. WP4_3_2]MBB6102702.1 hypothetical protein [Paraburkholderia bannensis]